MEFRRSLALAIGGLAALAAAIGIGRFVYTPILPAMLEALGWSKADAGLVASANFLGYFLGAVAAGRSLIARRPRQWLLSGLAASAITTAGMALDAGLAWFVVLRFAGGAASALVIVCASTLVLERLAASGHGALAAIHFAGVGGGIMISAAAVSAITAAGGDWRLMWAGAAVIAFLGVALATLLIPAAAPTVVAAARAPSAGLGRLAPIIVAYGLVGLGYVITSTFLVTIVRSTPAIRALEPWIWMLFGLAAVPSVALWSRLGSRIGLARAFAVAALVEALGVAASVEWVSIAGVCMSAILLGGTFMGLTALGLMVAREASGDQAQQAIGRMTASFSIGQMAGPLLAGHLYEQLGSFRAASLVAAAGLVIAAFLARWMAGSSHAAPRPRHP